MGEVIFPSLERIAVRLPDRLRARLDAFIAMKGWTPQEAVKILLAYGADAMLAPSLTIEQIQNEWMAARAEMAVLRQRAYIADEAIRTLRLNLTGLERSNRQFEVSIRQQRARRDRLRQALTDREGGTGGADAPSDRPAGEEGP
ncbi:MAG: hypothetical protein QN168_01995 [Armatimonadota bacterium]|nr:hypothetical protein [Armatimonadota bacterium]